MNKYLFTEKQITVAAILAGPIPPGILIYLNYKRLGKAQEALVVIAATFLFTVSFFYIILNLPESVSAKIPSFVYTLIYGLLVYVFFRFFMSEELLEAFETGYERASNWSVVWLTLLGLIINLIIVFWMATLYEPYPGEKQVFGNNTIYYESPINKIEVEKLANHLTDVAYFSESTYAVAHVQVIEGRYRVTLPMNQSEWEDYEVIEMLEGLKMDLENDFGEPTDVVVEDYDLSGRTLRRAF